VPGWRHRRSSPGPGRLERSPEGGKVAEVEFGDEVAQVCSVDRRDVTTERCESSSLGGPWTNNTRKPMSRCAFITASACSGEFTMCERSAMAVTPLLRALRRASKMAL
jgi:hypothetical protein